MTCHCIYFSQDQDWLEAREFLMPVFLAGMAAGSGPAPTRKPSDACSGADREAHPICVQGSLSTRPVVGSSYSSMRNACTETQKKLTDTVPGLELRTDNPKFQEIWNTAVEEERPGSWSAHGLPMIDEYFAAKMRMSQCEMAVFTLLTTDASRGYSSSR